MAAFREIGPHLLGPYFEQVRGGYINEPGSRDLTAATEPLEVFYRIAHQRWLVGDAISVQRQTDRWRAEVSVSHFIMRFRHPTGPSHATTLEQIRARRPGCGEK